MTTKLLAVFIFTSLWSVQGTSVNDAHEKVAGIVAQIQRADYESNRKELRRCYDELAPFANDKNFASRVSYWRGFALWRRAINGANDKVDPAELAEDMKQACLEFQSALSRDETFVDAKVGLISCTGTLAFLQRDDPAAMQPLVDRVYALIKEVEAMAPDNPRFRWVLGPVISYQNKDSEDRLNKVIENYQKALDGFGKTATSNDPVEPSWGKPELMMSLAYAYANKKTPDLNVAERYARAALEIVPYWHYTRDILLPQILAAKEKAKQVSPPQ